MLPLEVAAQAGARGEAELADQTAVGLLASVDDLGARVERQGCGLGSCNRFPGDQTQVLSLCSWEMI